MYYSPYPHRPGEFERLHCQRTPRKIAAALRAVRRLEEKRKGIDPLFDDGVRMSGEEAARAADGRFEYYRLRAIDMVRQDRQRAAIKWLKLRRCRRRVPAAVRDRFDVLWNRKTYPGRPEYALDLMRRLVVEYFGLLVESLEEPLFEEAPAGRLRQP